MKERSVSVEYMMQKGYSLICTMYMCVWFNMLFFPILGKWKQAIEHNDYQKEFENEDQEQSEREKDRNEENHSLLRHMKQTETQQE